MSSLAPRRPRPPRDDDIEALIREARARQRRRALITAAALVAVVVGLGALRGRPSHWPLPARGGSSALATASFPSLGLSFRYPANWKRLDCVQNFTLQSNVTYLTNAPTAACYHDPPGETSSRPPAIRLAQDGVLVHWWDYEFWHTPDFAGRTATIGGMPARVSSISKGDFAPALTSDCSSVRAEAAQVAKIRRHVGGPFLVVTACFRGPNVSANAVAFRRMLTSVRIAKR